MEAHSSDCSARLAMKPAPSSADHEDRGTYPDGYPLWVPKILNLALYG